MDLNSSGLMTGKLALLHASLRKLERVAVAYSGGVDSTLLLHAAVQALGPDRVIAVHAVSCLNGAIQREQALALFGTLFPDGVELRRITVDPLGWEEFVENTDQRCYFCKKRLYRRFSDEFSEDTARRLLDGTNADDVLQHRPGIQAIRELEVMTPLLDAGLSKMDIRLLAQQAGLPNHALPANSCLATRVGSGRRIEARLLQHIDMAEAFLHRSGYPGSRFRLVQNDIHLEIRHEEMERFQREDIRSAFQTYVSDLGYGFNFNNVTCR
ncbi:MAG: ATP-dependent sacrificial sulfur transferase LarE [Desulfoprunum sp.]|uniref:ATP-dependent sacrificial sulfur transferase LarE n=1 Tax=Desulfoprunum sp. TaxID=2020866 RepID=UPI003C71B546